MNIFTIAGISGSGPKATSVSFLRDADGVRQWTWLPNDVAARLRPGMTVTVEEVSTGRVETSYEKDGQQVALKTPKQQVFLYGQISFGKPVEGDRTPPTFSFDEDATVYAATYDAKHHGVQEGEDPFV